MKRILTATDGSQHALKSLSFAADLAMKFDAELLVTHVVSESKISDEDRHLIETEYASEVADRRKQARSPLLAEVDALPKTVQFDYEEDAAAIQNLLGERLLKSAEEFVRELGATRVHTVLGHGDPAKTILSIAKEDNIDLIVIASRGLGEMQALFLGSVSNKIAHLAHCPVTLVR